MSKYHLSTPEFINLELTFLSGQTFSFIKTGDNEFSGNFNQHIITFYQSEKEVFYTYYKEIQSELEYFFTLDISYTQLFKEWDNLIDFSFVYSGLRLLRCELVETIFSFICSSNNNVKRITKMVNYLCSKGKYLGNVNTNKIFSFPSIKELVDCEDELLKNGFGYRAKYVCGTAKILVGCTNIQKECLNLKFLRSLKGVGPKVSDCIRLMGLSQFHVVPIDTHIFKASKRFFAVKSKKYEEMQNEYFHHFGEYSGIAQLYIFKKYLDREI